MSLPSPAEIAAALIAREELPAEKGDIGPQGMDGKAGEFGPPGPQGAKGDPGRNGTNGSNGDIGPVGPQGKGGPRGPKGDKGDKGDEGERGPIGPMGPTGAVGSGKALFPRPGGGGSGSGLPAGGAVGQVVTNTAPGAGTWQNAAGGDIEAVLTEGNDAGGQEITNLVGASFTVEQPFDDVVVINVPDDSGAPDADGNNLVIRVHNVAQDYDPLLLDNDGHLSLLGILAQIEVGETAFVSYADPTRDAARAAGRKWGVLGTGQEFLMVAAAPADGAIVTSHRAHYLDDAVGAVRVRFKQRDSADTLTSGYYFDSGMLSGNAAQYLDGTGVFSTPAGGGSGSFLSIAKWT